MLWASPVNSNVTISSIARSFKEADKRGQRLSIETAVDMMISD